MKTLVYVDHFRGDRRVGLFDLDVAVGQRELPQD